MIGLKGADNPKKKEYPKNTAIASSTEASKVFTKDGRLVTSSQSIADYYAVITYFENGLPVACHPLMPGEVVMNPDSCLEHVIRSGYVVMPCDEAEKFTLGEIQKMIVIARQARDRWLQP